MRGRGADDRIDCVASRLGHWAKANARLSPVRRVETADFLLLATVSLWALNFTVSKYILDHGFHPLSYSAVRYSAAALIFVAVTFPWERSLRIARSDWPLVALAVGLLLVNQLSFVYALYFTPATTPALHSAPFPICTPPTQTRARHERRRRPS